MIEFVHGDLFDTSADIRVNTVNCVGVMGAGVALAFKQRYPKMFRDYQRDCRIGRVVPGKMHVWKSLSGDWIINFPTKRHWREPSQYEDIEVGLDDLRNYLDQVGPVKITLPALGCGHGGLEWNRVSEMIRKKLDGVEAHVLVFEPAASRRATNTNAGSPTDDERLSAERLGYTVIAPSEANAAEILSPVYVLGARNVLASKWIALLPSRQPGEREKSALHAIADELARTKDDSIIVALVYGARSSEIIADIFIRKSINVVLLLPFGVLTRKSIAKKVSDDAPKLLVVASVVPANAKWSRQAFAQTTEILRANACAALLSDPEPDWLQGNNLNKWGRTPLSYVRYESTPPSAREALDGVNARAIGRRGDSGIPNIDRLIDVLVSQRGDQKSDAQVEPNSKVQTDIARECDEFAVTLDETSAASKRKLFEALIRMKEVKIALTVQLPKDASEEDRRYLLDLGCVRDSA